MLDRTCLPRQAAALDSGIDVELADNASHLKRLAQNHLQHRTREIGFQRPAIHRNLARPRPDPDPGNRILPLAGRIRPAQRVPLWLDRSRGNNNLLGALGDRVQFIE